MTLLPVSRIQLSPNPGTLVAALRPGSVAICALAICAALSAATGSSFAQSPAQNPSLAADPAQAQNSPSAQDPVIARVGNVEIRESDVRLAEEEFGKDLPPHEGVDLRDYLINFLGDMIRLSKEAQVRNVGDEAEIKRRMELTREKALMKKLLEVTGRAAATDENTRQAFDIYVEKNPPQPELHLRYILFKFPSLDDKAAVDAAEAKAKEAIKLAAGGEDFAALATKMSENIEAKIDRGDLGFLTRNQMGKDYAEVAFKLRKGEVSAPIKTAFGWHVIKVEDERMSKPAEFDQMRASLASYLSRNAQLQLVGQLRKDTPLERIDQAAAAKPAEAGK